MRLALAVLGLITTLFIKGVPAQTSPVLSKVLILAVKGDTGPNALIKILKGYGVPYESITIDKPGYTLPFLKGPDGVCNYGAVVTSRQLWGSYGSDWVSFMDYNEWLKIYYYQQFCGVRLVHIGAVPNQWDFACHLINSTDSAEQNKAFGANHQFFLDPNVAKAEFPTAGLKNPKNAYVSSIWHTPGFCDDSLLGFAWGMTSQNAILYTEAFGLNGAPGRPPGYKYTQPSLGVINRYSDGREQMAFFSAFSEFAEVSLFMSHILIHWAFRGLIPGRRASILGLQVDDLFLPTNVYGTDYIYRISTADALSHADWQIDLNSRLAKSNPGSDVFLEFGFNGNGPYIYDQTVLGLDKNGTCPPSITYTGPQIVTSLEWAKPPGTGTDLWPKDATYNWPENCVWTDPLAKLFLKPNTGGSNINGLRDIFAFVSHTFTHEGENPITAADAIHEIQFNQQFAKISGLDKAPKYSPGGLIPPAITGLHNPDALTSWHDNGITAVVGDNTRPPLRNSQSDRWPLITNVPDNGFAGMVVIPRWANRIYYNADGIASDLKEWLDVTNGLDKTSSFQNLLDIERTTTTQYLLGLYHDPYMFHQVNLRMWNNTSITIAGNQGPWSLIEMWTESILDEFTQYVDWPIESWTHDELGDEYVKRMNRDLYSSPYITWMRSADLNTITGFTVDVLNSSWAGEIPVMIPSAVTGISGARSEKNGNNPETLWVSSFPSSFTFKTPIPLKGSKINSPVSSILQAVTTTLPEKSVASTAPIGSFPVSEVLSGITSQAKSLLASEKAANATTDGSGTSKTSTISPTLTGNISSYVSGNSTSKPPSSGLSKTSSGSSTATTGHSASKTSSTASSSSSAAAADGDVTRFLNSVCNDSVASQSVGIICQMWASFKSTGKISKRMVLPEGVPDYTWDYDGHHPDPETLEKRTKEEHQRYAQTHG